MANLTIKLYAFTLALVFGALSGCSSESPSEKWVEAPEALGVFQAAAKIEAISTKSSTPDVSCEAVIHSARDSFSRPNSSGFQVIARACGDAGLEFGEEIRCKSGRLQVKCQ